MKCPKCNKEIEKVTVISESWQRADIDENGKITDYGSTEMEGDTERIECPECSGDIRSHITE